MYLSHSSVSFPLFLPPFLSLSKINKTIFKKIFKKDSSDSLFFMGYNKADGSFCLE